MNFILLSSWIFPPKCGLCAGDGNNKNIDGNEDDNDDDDDVGNGHHNTTTTHDLIIEPSVFAHIKTAIFPFSPDWDEIARA